MNLTLEVLENVLQTRFGGVISRGGHCEGDGKACVRELRAAALGFWTCNPDAKLAHYGNIDAACQNINDAVWLGNGGQNIGRTKYCLPLALLSSRTAPVGWELDYLLRILHEVLPNEFRFQGMTVLAELCEEASSEESAREAWWKARSFFGVTWDQHIQSHQDVTASTIAMIRPQAPPGLCRVLYQSAAGPELPPWPYDHHPSNP